uniref:WASH complex subunit 3 n=1 Tax=Neogobius melanostomus TaxID=47308 RepID=A0A8C6UG69_9GOBI
MDEDGLPIVGSGVDLTKVPAIQQRRTVAYLNQFIVHTVRFLNRFSTVCEEVCMVYLFTEINKAPTYFSPSLYLVQRNLPAYRFVYSK